MTRVGAGVPGQGAAPGRVRRPQEQPVEGLTREALVEVLLDAWDVGDCSVMIVDEHLVVVSANASARESAGHYLTADGRAGPLTGAERTASGELLREERRPLRRALAGELVHGEELVIPGADGEPPRRLLVSASPLPPRDGRRLALVSWRDVTSRWRLDLERRDAFDRLARMIDGAVGHAIFLLDPEGRVLTWSVCAEQVKRYREEEVLGRHFELFFTEEDRRAGLPDRILRESAEQGRSVTEGTRVRGDGTTFRARGVVTAQFDDQQRLTGFVKVANDVSAEYENRERIRELNDQLTVANEDLERRIEQRSRELERQTRELLSANAELEAFASSLSHDLRAPLRAVAGFADLLHEDHLDQLDERARHYLSRIRAGAEEMGTLIEAMLRLARVQQQGLHADVLDMTALARQAWSDLSGPDGVRLDLGPLPAATGDADLVRQVWINLLDNAVKFSSGAEDPLVVVRGWTQDGMSLFEVRDNGVGFDARGSDRLFQPFSRLHHVEDFPGTGVGLALVQRIVQRHGGRVEATSAAGDGAAFTFSLGSA